MKTVIIIVFLAMITIGSQCVDTGLVDTGQSDVSDTIVFEDADGLVIDVEAR